MNSEARLETMLTQATSECLDSHPDFDQHERVVIHDDGRLRAIIAVHNSNLGPATGGCRIFPYDSTDHALTDVLRLSRGMTYKSALAGLPLGGGKSVIIADPARDKTADLMHAMGDFIESFDGLYVAAEDSGTSVADMQLMAQRTRHVSGVLVNERFGGDPSPVTARGVFLGIQAAVRHRLGCDLSGVRVAVQGAGNVGYHLIRLLCDAGAVVVVADADASRVQRVTDEFGVAGCSTGDILTTQADVLAPCAMGGAINGGNIDTIRARVIAGAANNQLQSDALGELLYQRGILYAPDYVINSGGIIDIYYQRQGMRDASRINAHVDNIEATLERIFGESDRRRCATNAVADEMARARFMHAAPSVTTAQLS